MIIRVGDVGTELVVTVKNEQGVPVDISAAATAGTKVIYLTPPGGPTVALPAIFDTTGVDGLMKYVTLPDGTAPLTVPGTLNKSGTWEIAGWVDIGIPEWSCDPSTFTVLPSRRFVDSAGNML
jgi:hypothetical protein